MATDTIDLAIRDDLEAQVDCRYQELFSDRLYPACHPDLLEVPAEQRTSEKNSLTRRFTEWLQAAL